jgi:hypothetical protein
MQIAKHLIEQPFLVAVSLAAAIHSSWSFSVMFTGLEPQPQFSPMWFAWIFPGVMLAFSVDIGLLSLANQIRLGHRTKGKLLAFAVLCGAMGFLQFLYIAAHQPEVHLGAGIRSDWIGLVTLIRDSSIWILPLLLPTALILFAFSDTAAHENAMPSNSAISEPAAPSRALALVGQDGAEQLFIETPERIEVECSETSCNWSGSYETSRAAQNALTAHRRKHNGADTNGKQLAS